MHILINVFVFSNNWPDASLEGARGKLIPVVVVALPSVSRLTTSHSVTNSISNVILICLKITSDLEFKGNNSQCRQGHPLLMQKCCLCTFCLLVSQLTTLILPHMKYMNILSEHTLFCRECKICLD